MHCHSKFSDGVLSPKELLLLAQKKELSLFSITDHDTIYGTSIAKEESEKYPFIYLTGIELSSRFQNQKIEILGYNFSTLNIAFKEKLEFLQSARKRRIHKIINKLEEIGIKITHDDILLQIKDGVSAGRPHIARALVEKGYVKDVTEAFNVYLGEGKPGYVQRETIEPKEAIKLIHSAGGIAFLPHPLLIDVENIGRLEYYLDLLLSWGLEGIEVYYNYEYHFPHFSEKAVKKSIKFLINYCKRNNLLMSGGSDFHEYESFFGNVFVPQREIKRLIHHFTS